VVLKAFSPIVGLSPKILILGSMPSVISLRDHQYYGNPNNSFWWIMAQLLGFSEKLPYSERVAELEKSPFAVWDVLSDCERQGSLDSSIVRSSEVPNDIASFLQTYSNVTLLAFNGGAAERIFRRHCSDLVTKEVLQRQVPETILLPSTSPAYASMKKQEKLDCWSKALSAHI